jgi:DNA-binding transcriptional LysR family regulator
VAEQNRTGTDWEDIRVFLALARHGSLSAAARILSINHATVARRIHSLEATLGEKLVDRRPDGYVLTPAGVRTMTAAGDMEAAATTLGRGGLDGTPKGLVRVNAPPALTQGFLLSRLAELPARYPGLELDMATGIRSVSLERRETDIAVRIGRPQDSDLIARQVGTISYGFYATPALCQRLAGGEKPVFVGFDESNSDLPEAVWLSRQFPRAHFSFRANNQVGQAIAAKADAGVALLPHYIGRSEPALRACPLRPVPLTREVWLLKRRQDRKDMAIRTVVEHITQVFAKDRDLFDPPPDIAHKPGRRATPRGRKVR